MPDIITPPPLVRARSPVRTRLRPTTNRGLVTARQRVDLRRRRRALEKEIRELETTLRNRISDHTALTQEVELANNHRNDDFMRSRDLTDRVRRIARISQAEQETDTELGRRFVEARRLYDEYLVNRPDDNEGIARLEAEYRPLHRTILERSEAVVAPLIEERTLAQRNFDLGNRAYLSLDGRLINHSLLTRDLTNARDNLLRQSNLLNIELGQGKRRQRRTKRHKKGKKGKHTRK